ncbi:hypothetical protein [Bacteroides pyogenes]|uniref:hypothetical protein n=1 Tax=Bacteroides pyogenes TaxID=310300 RepID=UPI001F259204|nr:hypothetical protein [Bacteroides pyogenes]MCF2707865.1 hypothetical protein [Bacteroides pyogenes]
MKKTWKLFGIFTLFMPLKSFVAPIMLRVKKQAVTPLRDMPDRCGEPKKAIYLVRVAPLPDIPDGYGSKTGIR